MKPIRTRQADLQAANLPDVPDYPESPLLPWKHYGILKLAEKAIHEELEQDNNEGRLIGLRVSYFVETAEPYQDNPGDEFTMAFGYSVTAEVTDEESGGEPSELDFVVLPSEEFLDGLYNYVNDLIANNINPYVPSFTVRMDVALTVANTLTTCVYTFACRTVRTGECPTYPAHVGERRRMRYNSCTGQWRCRHTLC